MAAHSANLAALWRHIERDRELYQQHGLLFTEDPVHTKRWNRKFSRHQQLLFDPDGRIRRDAIEQFLSQRLYVGDNPHSDLNSRTPLNLLSGPRKGQKAVLHKCLQVLEDSGAAHLLRKYPCSEVGSPYRYRYDGMCLTHRWCKHIYALGNFNHFLGRRLKRGFACLDIGCSYGAFQSLLYREHPGCHQVLVDLPEQLLLARYFLQANFPDATIAGVEELSQHKTISRSLVETYDFVLLPPDWYRRLEPAAVDVVTSFACLGELKREFFEFYVDAPVFQTAEYLYTINPITAKSFLFKDSDVTVLDYPLDRGSGKLYFELCPMYFHSYRAPRRRAVFWYILHDFPPFFEYIGSLAGRRALEDH